MLDSSRISEPAQSMIPLKEVSVQMQIGEGGFGKVYAGTWRDSPVVYKKFHCQQISSPKLKWLMSDVEILKCLQHPNIVRIFGLVTEEDNIGIVTEYLPKTLFQALFIEETVFDPIEKRRLIKEIITALLYLHEADIAHGDLKCQNVLLDSTNMPKFCDYGLYSVVKTSIPPAASAQHQAIGTSRYWAPEILRGEALKLAEVKMADIYSLSLVIYQVLAEEDPFEDLSVSEFLADVGKGDKRPHMTGLADVMKDLLAAAWNSIPSHRPDAKSMYERWGNIHIDDFYA